MALRFRGAGRPTGAADPLKAWLPYRRTLRWSITGRGIIQERMLRLDIVFVAHSGRGARLGRARGGVGVHGVMTHGLVAISGCTSLATKSAVARGDLCFKTDSRSAAGQALREPRWIQASKLHCPGLCCARGRPRRSVTAVWPHPPDRPVRCRPNRPGPELPVHGRNSTGQSPGRSG